MGTPWSGSPWSGPRGCGLHGRRLHGRGLHGRGPRGRGLHGQVPVVRSPGSGSPWSASPWSGSLWLGSPWSGSPWSGSPWSGSPWLGSAWGCVPGPGAARAPCCLPVPAASCIPAPGPVLPKMSDPAGAEGQRGLAVGAGGVLLTLSPQPQAWRAAVLRQSPAPWWLRPVLGSPSAARGRGRSGERGTGPAEHHPGTERGCGRCQHPWEPVGELRLEGLTESCGNFMERGGGTAAGREGGAAPRCSRCLRASQRRQRRAWLSPAAVELPGDAGSPPCPIPGVLMAREGDGGSRSPGCGRRRSVTGTGGQLR